MQLSGMSRLTDIDFSKFDLDEPLPELTTNGHQSSLAKWIGKTPRSIVQSYASKVGIDFTGTHRPRGGHDAGDHGGGGRRRLPALQQLLRPALHHGGVRRAGARAAPVEAADQFRCLRLMAGFLAHRLARVWTSRFSAARSTSLGSKVPGAIHSASSA